MEKAARKELEKQLTNHLLTELKKQNERAALKTMKHLKEAAKSIAKKFAKAANALQKAKEAATARRPIAVKAVTRKAMPKTAAKAFRRKK